MAGFLTSQLLSRRKFIRRFTVAIILAVDCPAKPPSYFNQHHTSTQNYGGKTYFSNSKLKSHSRREPITRGKP